MLTERGINVSYETIRRWVLKFGPAIATKVRSRRVQAPGTRNQEPDVSMKFLSALVANGLIFGAPLTMKEKFLKSWSNLVETNVRPLSLCGNS